MQFRRSELQRYDKYITLSLASVYFLTPFLLLFFESKSFGAKVLLLSWLLGLALYTLARYFVPATQRKLERAYKLKFFIAIVAILVLDTIIHWGWNPNDVPIIHSLWLLFVIPLVMISRTGRMVDGG